MFRADEVDMRADPEVMAQNLRLHTLRTLCGYKPFDVGGSKQWQRKRKAVHGRHEEEVQGGSTQVTQPTISSAAGRVQEEEGDGSSRRTRSPKARGIPMMNQDIGVPLGQRVLMPYQLSHTDIYAEADDLHFVNNAAMQQCWDDIRRTVISGWTPPITLLRRDCRRKYPRDHQPLLETVNHAMPGGAVVQEHMAECSPALTADCT